MNTTANPMLGSLIFALGGFAGAVFAVPFRKVKGWAYESYWFVYAVVGLIVFPAALAFATVPDLCGVLAKTPTATLLGCAGYGALWGVGGLTWGLMIRYLGVGLGLAIGCGLCSATGTLIPPILQGKAGDLVKDSAALITLGGVALSLVGSLFIASVLRRGGSLLAPRALAPLDAHPEELALRAGGRRVDDALRAVGELLRTDGNLAKPVGDHFGHVHVLLHVDVDDDRRLRDLGKLLLQLRHSLLGVLLERFYADVAVSHRHFYAHSCSSFSFVFCEP